MAQATAEWLGDEPLPRPAPWALPHPASTNPGQPQGHTGAHVWRRGILKELSLMSL